MKPSAPSLLVHEYMTGGAFGCETFLPGYLKEGLGMVKSVLADLAKWGRFDVKVTLDKRLDHLCLNANSIIRLHHKKFPGNLAELMRKKQDCLIIAPEDDGELTKLSQLALDKGCVLWGSSPKAIDFCADKWRCGKLMKKFGLTTPETRLLRKEDALKQACDLGFPLIVKPRTASDCTGISFVERKADFEEAFLKAADEKGQAIIQEFIPGQAASVSLVSNGKKALALSFNFQDVNIDKNIQYLGGLVNAEHPLKQKALALSEKLVANCSGLMGYCGVDLVLTDSKCYLLEINPRFTTSYVGLSQVSVKNPMKAIWQAVCLGYLPENWELSDQAFFSKENMSV